MGSEARIKKCQIAELLALTHHRGEVRHHGVGLQSTGKHRVAGHTVGLFGQAFTYTWSCLLPVFWDALLANKESGRNTKEGHQSP